MRPRWFALVIQMAAAIAVLGIIVLLAFRLSPWPSAMLIRRAFNKEAVRVNKALDPHVPDSVATIPNLQYDATDRDALLDVYFPAAANGQARFPVIVWIHGGGLISGDKGQVANYCKILAAAGFTVAAIDYGIAPERQYPGPLQQANAALAYLAAHASRFHADSSFFVIAGDSGGSMIAAQTANVIYNPAYAGATRVAAGIAPRQLRGLLLYCGIYDISDLDLSGGFGSFLKTAVWSYAGKKDWQNDDYFQTVSVYRHLTDTYPPCFISAGNGDPLLSQSQRLASRLRNLGVRVDTLFFPASLQPALPHEYQFNLDIPAGKEALAQSLLFLKSLQRAP